MRRGFKFLCIGGILKILLIFCIFNNMDEIEFFKQHVLKKVALTPEEMTELVSGFRLRKVKKKQWIIQPEFTALHRRRTDGCFSQDHFDVDDDC